MGRSGLNDDGVTRDQIRDPMNDTTPMPSTETETGAAVWTGRLVIFLRVMAVLSMAKGLYHWAEITGFIGDAVGRGGVADHNRLAGGHRTDFSGGLWRQHDRTADRLAVAKRVFGARLDGSPRAAAIIGRHRLWQRTAMLDEVFPI